MNYIYTICGILSIILGIYIIAQQIKKIKAGEDDELGFDYKLLGGGIMAVVLGIALILKYL
jgi:hypothetical protein